MFQTTNQQGIVLRLVLGSFLQIDTAQPILHTLSTATGSVEEKVMVLDVCGSLFNPLFALFAVLGLLFVEVTEVINPSMNQPTKGKRTSMLGIS